jgi:hypothetical protein
MHKPQLGALTERGCLRAGALHGSAWVPDTWWLVMENEADGRDELLALARRLAQLDVRE